MEGIASRYPTPISLYRAYQGAMEGAAGGGRNVHAAARELLAGLRVRSEEGAPGGRSLGAVAAARVYDHLFANGMQLLEGG